MKKGLILILVLLLTVSLLGACGPKTEAPKDTGGSEAEAGDKATMLLAAAASLEASFRDELIPMFVKDNPNITVDGTYDSSGKLQTQIEEGMEASVFMSAAVKQMNASSIREDRA